VFVVKACEHEKSELAPQPSPALDKLLVQVVYTNKTDRALLDAAAGLDAVF
jgi:hypothetical protein